VQGRRNHRHRHPALLRRTAQYPPIHPEYTNVNRYEQIADNVLVTATGEFADFQEATRKLKELTHETYLYDDNVHHSVKDYANYLARLCYEKRNNQNPYFNNFVIAGFENGQAYLSSIDLYGNHITKDYVTAGFSKYFGLALIANQWNPTKTFAECKAILHKCFTVLYERDCHSIDQVQFASVTAEGVQVHAPEHVGSDWDFRDFRERKNEKLWQ
jgi:20S proteasome subunit beta 7